LRQQYGILRKKKDHVLAAMHTLALNRAHADGQNVESTLAVAI